MCADYNKTAPEPNTCAQTLKVPDMKRLKKTKTIKADVDKASTVIVWTKG